LGTLPSAIAVLIAKHRFDCYGAIVINSHLVLVSLHPWLKIRLLILTPWIDGRGVGFAIRRRCQYFFSLPWLVSVEPSKVLAYLLVRHGWCCSLLILVVLSDVLVGNRRVVVTVQVDLGQWKTWVFSYDIVSADVEGVRLLGVGNHVATVLDRGVDHGVLLHHRVVVRKDVVLRHLVLLPVLRMDGLWDRASKPRAAILRLEHLLRRRFLILAKEIERVVTILGLLLGAWYNEIALAHAAKNLLHVVAHLGRHALLKPLAIAVLNEIYRLVLSWDRQRNRSLAICPITRWCVGACDIVLILASRPYQ